jgi:hypothetical protein
MSAAVRAEPPLPPLPGISPPRYPNTLDFPVDPWRLETARLFDDLRQAEQYHQARQRPNMLLMTVREQERFIRDFGAAWVQVQESYVPHCAGFFMALYTSNRWQPEYPFGIYVIPYGNTDCQGDRFTGIDNWADYNRLYAVMYEEVIWYRSAAEMVAFLKNDRYWRTTHYYYFSEWQAFRAAAVARLQGVTAGAQMVGGEWER